MYRVELYAAVRRSVYVEGLSERAAARRVGLARETVRKMLRDRRPPGYRRGQPARRPKLDAFTGVIDQILREDQARPKKQRHRKTRDCEGVFKHRPVARTEGATWSSTSRTATTGLCRRFRPRRRRRSAPGTTPRSNFGGVVGWSLTHLLSR